MPHDLTLREGHVKYAPNERRVFEALSKRPNGATISEIIKLIYGGSPPWHARTIINGNLHRLAKKIEANDEPFRIYFSERAGPNEILITLQPTRS